jgi:RNA polymerase sigma-70 factor (ECF subfamily)
MPLPAESPSQRELIERAKHDREAFGALFELHFDSIFGYAYRRTGDWDAACDITSEVFVNALEHISRFRWTGAPFSGWLFRIASNQLRMYFRRGKRRTSTLVAFAAEQDFGTEEREFAQKEREAAEEERLAARHFAAVQAALLELSLKYQEVLSLRFFEQKSNEEIAAILEKPVGTIKSLVSRGLEQLRRRLPPVQPNVDDGIT